MRNIEIFPSKHMYLYLSLVERKVAEFYHIIVKMTYFHRFLQTIDGVLAIGWFLNSIYAAHRAQLSSANSHQVVKAVSHLCQSDVTTWWSPNLHFLQRVKVSLVISIQYLDIVQFLM